MNRSLVSNTCATSKIYSTIIYYCFSLLESNVHFNVYLKEKVAELSNIKKELDALKKVSADNESDFHSQNSETKLKLDQVGCDSSLLLIRFIHQVKG